MKKLLISFLILMVIFLATTASLVISVDIPWWNIGSSGEHMSAGTVELDGVIGQGIIGFSSQPPDNLCSGFLCVLGRLRLSLPIILKPTP